MKILILRTINYKKIWEDIQNECVYYGLAYKIIKEWEPKISDLNINNVKFGLGIYAQQYFEGIGNGEQSAYQRTENENKPSILVFPDTQNNSSKLIKDNGFSIIINYRLHKKIENFNNQKMLELDRELVLLKKKELGNINLKEKYPSLCFTLEEELVEKAFVKIGMKMI